MITVKQLTKIYKTPKKSKNFLTDFLFRKYDENIALNNVSFEIGENELIGFIGPNGAGKTTMMKVLSGILYPTSGVVNVLGSIPFEKKPNFLKQISFVMGQRNQLIWDLPAMDTFKLNKEIYEVNDDKFKRVIEELTSILSVKKLIYKPIKTLSLGERMKMELIAALIHSPKLIFFDEPTIGLDIFSQEIIREFIKKYQELYKSTIILTSHYMEDVKRLAKRLIVINKGNILYDGNMKSVMKKYSKEKYIRITLEKDIDPKILAEIGTPISYKFPQIVFKVERSTIPKVVKQITESLSFSDLTVEEEPIEVIIKKLFSKEVK